LKAKYTQDERGWSLSHIPTDGSHGCALHVPNRSLSFNSQEYFLNIGVDWVNTPIWRVHLKEEGHWNSPKAANDFSWCVTQRKAQFTPSHPG